MDGVVVETRKLQEQDAKEKEKHRTSSNNTAANSESSGANAASADGEGGTTRTRAQKRKATDDQDDFATPDEHDEHEGMDAASIREHEEVTKVKVRCCATCQS